MKKQWLWLGLGLTAITGSLACRSGGTSGGEGATIAVAELKDHHGARFGRVTFTEQMQGIVSLEIIIDAKTSTTATKGNHAIHIHEGGACTPPSFESAGGHFNPTSTKHGSPEGPGHHAGDLGNIDINGDREAKKNINSSEMTLVDNQPASIVGRTFVVHANEDDYVTQEPPGNSGTKIACGVITRQ